MNHHDSDRFLSDIIVCVGALFDFVKTAMRRKTYACAMCAPNLPNSSFERWIRDKSKLPACFDHHFSPPPPTVEVWFLVGPSWQILNKNNDANCKCIYIYILQIFSILFWLEPVISFCVFFVSGPFVRSLLLHDKQVDLPWSDRCGMRCHVGWESFSGQGTYVLKIDVQPMCCIILYIYIHVCVTYHLRRT